MRIAGISNMYGYLNTSAAQRYSALRNGQSTKTGSAYGANKSYGASSVYGVNKSYGTSRVYGTGSNYRAQAAAKVDAIYEETKTAAKSLRTYGQNLMDSHEDGLLSQAEKKGTTREYVEEVTNFVDAYNTMVKNMGTTGGTMNNLYAGQMKTDYSSHKEDLAAVGITAAKDGSLNIDKSILEKADISALKKAFGSTGSFAGKMAVKSIYVEANAVSDQTSAQYARFQSSYGGYGSYGGYSYSPYSRYYDSMGSYGNYSALGSALGLGSYGSGYGYSNLVGTLFNSLF